MKNLALIRIAVCTTILLIVFISTSVFAETFFSGTIDRNATWDIAGSPYILQGNVTIGKERYIDKNKNGRWDSSPEKFSDFGYDKIPGTGILEKETADMIMESPLKTNIVMAYGIDMSPLRI
ncbi:MAG: hypothetical protein PF503_06865 [Desulfobacula sp.]|jgi:hypothetical protein|nr:hypothetical protein [Desulfobacula sp.]